MTNTDSVGTTPGSPILTPDLDSIVEAVRVEGGRIAHAEQKAIREYEYAVRALASPTTLGPAAMAAGTNYGQMARRYGDEHARQTIREQMHTLTAWSGELATLAEELHDSAGVREAAQSPAAREYYVNAQQAWASMYRAATGAALQWLLGDGDEPFEPGVHACGGPLPCSCNAEEAEELLKFGPALHELPPLTEFEKEVWHNVVDRFRANAADANTTPGHDQPQSDGRS